MPGGPCMDLIISIIDFSLGIWLSIWWAASFPNLYIRKMNAAKIVMSITCLGFVFLIVFCRAPTPGSPFNLEVILAMAELDEEPELAPFPWERDLRSCLFDSIYLILYFIISTDGTQ